VPVVSTPPSIASVRFSLDHERLLSAVHLELGGADNHHGLVFGRAEPPSDAWPVLNRWERGVWWYDEITSMNERSGASLGAPWWLPRR